MPAGEGAGHRILVCPDTSKLYCTCSLRRRPCVHALALLQWVQSAGAAVFPEHADLPAWAQDLLRRPLTGSRSADAGNSLQATVQRQRRSDERLERAAAGLDELETWLQDTIRRGLATVASEDPRFWSTAATRMADASLPGIARMLRRLETLPAEQAEWPEQVAGLMADLYLAVRSFRQRDSLPEPLLADLMALLGISVKREEVLLSGTRRKGVWAVAGLREEPVEDRLWQRRCWLLGAGGEFALLLDFAFGDGAFPPGFRTGDLLEGELAFYPSAFPQRAVPVGELQVLQRKVTRLPGHASIGDMAAGYARALGSQPWLSIFPASFVALQPEMTGNRCVGLDAEGHMVEIDLAMDQAWRLVSIAGGQPLPLFGEWDGKRLRPLSYLADSALHTVV